MLKNEERLSKLKEVSQEQQERPVIQLANSLEFIVPTEFVDLPSNGIYYQEGHPLNGKNVIEIKQMTTKEEDILTNRSFIKKGIVIEKLLESIIIDKSINPSSLLIGDRNAIILAARASGYGEIYDISATCGSCNTKKNISINLNEFIEEQKEKLERKFLASEGNSILDSGNIVIELPKSKWIVECRPLTGKDEMYLINLAELKRKSSLAEDVSLVEQMSLMIVSIQLVTDRTLITEAIKRIPASDAKYLRKKYQELSPTFDMKMNFECDVCNYSQETEVGFNQEFFWPK